MDQMAAQVNEKTLFNRTGGAATLAAGMAGIFSKVTQGRWVDLWYHFAIMFEALFILTTIDAGTRVGRYLLQDILGSVWKPLGETKNLGANFLASSLMVGGWGYFLIQGVRDPLGGVNSLWPLFGIANQLLAAIGLCLGTTIILKMQLAPGSAAEKTSGNLPNPKHAKARTPNTPRPALALLTFVPLVWLLAVTTTAGLEKIFHHDPRIGFLAAASDCRAKYAKLKADLAGVVAPGSGTAEQNPEPAALELKRLTALERNNLLDAFVAGTFLALVWFILALSVREWILLLGRRKPAVLRESDPVWLPEYALREGNPARVAGLMTVAFALVKEVSGQGSIERAQMSARISAPQTAGPGQPTAGQVYAAASEQQFKGFTRCC
jgi:carbon starvation protein